MSSLAETTSFSSFCGHLSRLKRTQAAIDRKHEFGKYFRSLRKDLDFQNEELLPFLRILLSTLDSDRRFDIKHKKLAQRVGKLLEVPAAKLLAYDAYKPGVAVERLAAEVASRVSFKGNGLSVAEVSERLDRMADKDGRDPEDADFLFLFHSCKEAELIWIFNVMIRNVEGYIGASASSLLGMLDDAAKQRWTLNRSLAAVVDDISAGDVILGRNFRPMLLARLPRLTDWWEPIAQFSGTDFYVELKYDGEHVLLHRIGGSEYKYFTRNGKDFSEEYGRTRDDGNVTPRIHSFFMDACQDAVLDCELVLFDKEKKRICRHGASASDGKAYSYRYILENSSVCIAVVLFDVLFYNGRSLLNVPLEERIKVLEKGVLKRQADDIIYIAGRRIMNTRSEVDDYFAAAMKDDQEGIVVKRRDGLYLPGSRAKSNGWWKLKPNIASACTLDLAVVAIIPGGGQHGQEAYLVAARDERISKLVIVASVSVGLNDIDRKRIYQEATRDSPLSRTPHSDIRGSPFEEGKKGGFIHPDNVNVVEVACTGVRDGKLVDPVIKCIREKAIDEVDSTEQFEELAEVLRQCRLPEEGAAPKAGEKGRPGRAPKIGGKRDGGEGGVIPSKRTKDDEKEGRQDEKMPLAGKTVAVLQGTDAKARERAFQMLQRHGANVVANPIDGTVLIVAVTRNHPKTRAVAAKATAPVIDAAWLTRCDDEGAIVPWTDAECIADVVDGFKIDH